MPTPYEKSLMRIMSEKNKTPEFDIMNRSISRFTEPFGQINRNLQATLNQDNASVGAKIIATLRGNNQVQDMAEQMSQDVQAGVAAKNEKLNAQISETQLKIDQEKEQKRQERQARNTAMLRQGITAVSAAVGTAIAPGVGTLLGGAAGQTLSGFVGIDKHGNITADPEQWDTGQMVQGIADAGQILSSEITSNKLKKNNQAYITALPALSKRIASMNDIELAEYKSQRDYLQKYGTHEQYKEFLQKYSTPIYAPTNGNSVDKIRQKLYPEKYPQELYTWMYEAVQ